MNEEHVCTWTLKTPKHEPTDLHTPLRETLTKAHRRLKSETLAAGAVVERDRYLHQDETSGGGNARELSLTP